MGAESTLESCLNCKKMPHTLYYFYMDNSESSVTQAAMMAIMNSLTPLRQQSVKRITTELVNLRLSAAAIDAVLAAVILEAAEKQYVDEGGAVPPPRESSVDILKSLFTGGTNKNEEAN